MKLPGKSSAGERLALAGVFVAAVALHAVFQAGIFLDGSHLPHWDTHFYFPSFFYFPLASLLTDAQLPWWSPVSQGGIPLYYQMMTTYSPFFPTTMAFFAAAAVNELMGIGIPVYRLYIVQQLLLNPAVIILLAMLIARRLYRSTLAVAFVAGLVAFSGANNTQLYNAVYYSVAIMFLLFLYAFVLYFQRRSAGARLFLSLVVIFLALNFFSINFLNFMMYAVPLFMAGFLIFYRHAALQLFGEFAGSFSHRGRAYLVLAVLCAGLASWLVIAFNVDSFPRFDTVESFDPMLWSIGEGSRMIIRRPLPQLNMMFVDHGALSATAHDFAGIATLPLLVVGLVAGRGRMRFVLFFTFASILFLMSIPGAYILLANGLRSLEKNRHLGDIMYFGGVYFAYFGAGFGLDALLRKRDRASHRYRMAWALAALAAALFAVWLFLLGGERRLAANVLPWLFIMAAVGVSALGGRAARWPVRLLVSGLVVFTLSQMLYYNTKSIPAVQGHEATAPAFVELGKKLQFKMTGNYVTGNSILGGSQGYFFGTLYIPTPYKHPDFNYMRPERYTYLVDGMAGGRLTPAAAEQIVGYRFPRIRFPEKIYYADTREQTAGLLANERQLNNVAVLAGVGQPGTGVTLPVSGMAPSVRVDGFGFNELRLTVESDRERYLYYADGYDRFWYARVNGKRVTVHPANIVHKAVKIPEGRSVVVFKYNPWPIKALYLATLLCIVLLVLNFRKDAKTMSRERT